MRHDATIKYYYVDGSAQQAGPVFLPALKVMFGSKQIHASTYIWNKTMPEWLPLSAVPELLGMLKQDDDGPPPVPAAASTPQPPAEPVPPTAAAASDQTPAPPAHGATVGTPYSANSLLKRAGAHDLWIEKVTLDGAPWYHNEGTGEVSWDQPAALWGNDPNMHDDGKWVWVPDEKLGFVTAHKVSGTPENGLAVKLENGLRVQIPAGAKVFPLARSSLIRLEQDLVMLDALDEGMICHTLRNRFQADAFYSGAPSSCSACRRWAQFSSQSTLSNTCPNTAQTRCWGTIVLATGSCHRMSFRSQRRRTSQCH